MSDCPLYWVMMNIWRMPEFTQFDSGKSMIRNLPPKGAAGTHPDPRGVRGPRDRGGQATVLAHLPDPAAVTIDGQHEMRRVAGSDFFRWQGPLGTLSLHYRLCRRDGRGGTQERVDPYSFFPTLTSRDLTAFNGGFEARAWQFLGAQCMPVDGVAGARPFLSGAHAG